MHAVKETPEWVDKTVVWLDSKFTIPNTNIKFGIDPIVGLFPVVGDFLTYFIGLIIIFTVGKKGASGELMLRMLVNSGIDVILGAIPFLGIFFDVTYRSNLKNLKLMKAYYEEDKYQGNGAHILIAIVLTLLATICLTIYLIYKLSTLLIDWIGSI